MVRTEKTIAGRIEAIVAGMRGAHRNTAYMYSNGLVAVRPIRKSRDHGEYLRPIGLFVLVFFAFKILLLASLGELVYLARVDALESGTVIEQAAAYLMQPDMLTATLAKFWQVLVGL